MWGVRIADIPGCVGGGATPDEAVADATAALRDVVAHKLGGGHEIPKARSVPEVLATGEIASGEATVLIPLLLEAAGVEFKAENGGGPGVRLRKETR